MTTKEDKIREVIKGLYTLTMHEKLSWTFHDSDSAFPSCRATFNGAQAVVSRVERDAVINTHYRLVCTSAFGKLCCDTLIGGEELEELYYTARERSLQTLADFYIEQLNKLA